MKKALVFPGTFQLIKNYGGFDGIEIWLKSTNIDVPPADYYIGHSLGANYMLSLAHLNQKAKYILVNPLISKRNLFELFFSWIKFLITEGTGGVKLVPFLNYPFVFKKILELWKIDVLDIIQKLPKENIFIIRGKNDNFICDQKSAEVIKERGFNLIEVDAGHGWNENIAKIVKLLQEKYK